MEEKHHDAKNPPRAGGQRNGQHGTRHGVKEGSFVRRHTAIKRKKLPGAIIKKNKNGKDHRAEIGVIQQPAAKDLGI